MVFGIVLGTFPIQGFSFENLCHEVWTIPRISVFEFLLHNSKSRKLHRMFYCVVFRYLLAVCGEMNAFSSAGRVLERVAARDAELALHGGQ